MNIDEIRENEIEYCRDNLIYFIETYGHIEDKDADELIQPFKMWDAQKEAALSMEEHKLNICLKARQLGFTWTALHIASRLLVLYTGRTVVALSRTEEEAGELVRRMGVILRNMPEWVAEKGSVPAGWKYAVFTQRAMSISIDYPDEPSSIFKAFPSSENAARSFTADLILFDEWAFQQYAEKIWLAGFPTINRPNGGKVIGISTIERGSFFENLFTDPDNGFNKIFIPWYADPNRDEEWYERTKRAMGDTITQEYPASIEEALQVPGGAFFPEVRRETHIDKERMTGNVSRYVCIDYGLDMFSAHWISVDTKGHAQVYREYDSPNKTIGEACDILRSLSEYERIDLWLAPPDLWNRDQVSGKSRALHFMDYGIDLTRTSNDFPAGCAGMKEWLNPNEGRPRLTFLEDAAPNLWRCLQKIQKADKRPNVYAKEPHNLTHDPDSLRCFCVYYINPSEVPTPKPSRFVRWDIMEDYEIADDAGKEYLRKHYGEPVE